MVVWRSLGEKPEELDQPEFPEELRYIWNWFLDVRTGESLTFTEISNWAALMGISILPHEVDLMKTLDRAYWMESQK